MSTFRNALNALIPIRERRETMGGTLAALNAEIIHDVNGDESATISLYAGAAAFAATVEFTGSVDGVNYFPVLAVPYFTSGSVQGATNAQPLLIDVIASTTNAVRVYCTRVAQLKKLRVRLSAWTTGSADVSIISDAQKSLHPALFDGRPTTLLITATGAASASVTATLPAVAGLRHYIDFITVTRSATAALTAAAAPVIVTTTNLPGALALTFGADVAGIGVDKVVEIDAGGTGLAATLAGTATTIVAPAWGAALWRINVGYRLGL